jgi:hypothetical protein
MITVNITKARDIAHQMRRAARAAEFAPLDIQATIPAQAAQTEAERQLIRDKYAAMQADIEASATPDAIKEAVANLLP